MADLITPAIPVFLVLIATELVVAHRRGRKVYRVNDTLDDLSCGVVSRLPGIFTSALTLGLYVATFELGRATLGWPALEGWLAWVVAMVGVDLAYYWFHRLSHEVNFLWASHVVHHQSEDYNLAVALRQSAFQNYFNVWFYLPLALLGVPPLVYVVTVQINTLYQFWIHTRLIDRMGPLELVLNTPSHHRVHHGADPKYLDRNYAGILIVWDRLFGSFQVEEEEPTYGTTKPLARWNSLWANLDAWADLLATARSFPRLRDRIRLFFAHPGWRPEQPEPLHEIRGRARFDADVAGPRKLYLSAQFALMLAATVGLLLGKDLALAAKLALATWIAATALALGLGFESRPSWTPVEALRLLALPLLAWWIAAPQVAAASGPLVVLAACGVALVSGLAAWRTQPA